MRVYNKILVPYDGTISTEATLRTSCRIARWNNSTVLVVIPYFAGKEGGGEREAINSGVRQISREMEIPMDVVFQDGRPSDTIIDVAHKQENDLIVLGKTTMNALEKFVIGSITGRIIGHARCDVIIVPEDRLLRWNRILLCTDGSSYSQAAVDNAISYASHYKKAINALSVIERTDEFYAVAPERANGMVEKADRELNEIILKAQESGVAVTPFLKEGEVGKTIVEVAEATRADMIIMGSHERVGVSRLLMGSAAKHVAMSTDCPVFIIKPE